MSRGRRTECRLDAARFRRCTKRRNYRGLRAGTHVFKVRVVGSRRAGVRYRWVVAAGGLFHRTAVSYDAATFDPSLEATRERLWITHGLHSGLIPRFRRLNPGITSLLYKQAIYSDGRNARAASDRSNVGGIGYADAEANHPDWFLLNSSGQRITYRRYSGYHLMDIGNASYQDALAKNAITQAKRDGWTGVFADDLALALYSTSATPAKYPNPTAWQGAVRSFLRR